MKREWSKWQCGKWTLPTENNHSIMKQTTPNSTLEKWYVQQHHTKGEKQKAVRLLLQDAEMNNNSPNQQKLGTNDSWFEKKRFPKKLAVFHITQAGFWPWARDRIGPFPWRVPERNRFEGQNWKCERTLKAIFGSHPSSVFAFVASPSSWSTSVGR